ADLIQVPCPPYRGVMETRVGPETARVCTAAARLSNCLTHALVYVTAGRAPRHGVLMGAGPMRTFLIESGMPQARIVFPIAAELTTIGPMQALARARYEKADRMQA